MAAAAAGLCYKTTRGMIAKHEKAILDNSVKMHGLSSDSGCHG